MCEYPTYSETEELLRIAIGIQGAKIKQIAELSGIKASTLYKWKTTQHHLCHENTDKLIRYFQTYELDRLNTAEIIRLAKHNII